MTAPQIVTVPCLADNYAFLLRSAAGGRTALIDAPEAGPVVAALEARGWGLDEIWITHHHPDHVAGVAELRARFGARVRVTGARADRHRLPPLDREVAGGEDFDFDGHAVAVLEVPGHTLGHVAFHVPGAGAVFTADSLMALGCGRLFEGTAAQMWESLGRIAALPPETLVCSGHEYTLANARFARTIEPGNAELMLRIGAVEAARAEGRPTVPSTLAEELATNPFLRAGQPEIARNLGMQGAAPGRVFAEIRARKDRF